jgi:hypothetical protein
MFIKQEFRQSSSSSSLGSFGILNHRFKAVSAISVSHPRTMVLAGFCGFHRFGGFSLRVEVQRQSPLFFLFSLSLTDDFNFEFVAQELLFNAATVPFLPVTPSSHPHLTPGRERGRL